jgi:hypothetical protein
VVVSPGISGDNEGCADDSDITVEGGDDIESGIDGADINDGGNGEDGKGSNGNGGFSATVALSTGVDEADVSSC